MLVAGVILCELCNVLEPGIIKRINRSKMPFPQRENIKAVIDATRKMGCAKHARPAYASEPLARLRWNSSVPNSRSSKPCCRGRRVADRNNFDTSDLFDARNPRQVWICMLALGRAAHGIAVRSRRPLQKQPKTRRPDRPWKSGCAATLP